jgi:uncharacterized protein with PQ loop repeat
MEIHHTIGWIGAFFFAISAIPQALKTWKTKSAKDLSWLFLILWLAGEIFTLSYIIIDDIILRITHIPLYVNYIFNTIVLLYLIYAKRHY